MHWLDQLGPLWFAALGTFVLHEAFYFGTHIFWLLTTYIPGADRYKLQPKVQLSWSQQWKCLIQVLFNHLCIELPMMLAVEPVFGLDLQPPFPSAMHVAWVVLASFVLEDFYFYWIHRFLHWGPIYRHVHKLHHDYAAPTGMSAEYAHPVETLFLGFGSMLGPILCANHLFEVWVWLCFRLIQTVEVHNGYDFPWSPNNWVPFWGGAKFHDFHHERFTGNYSSTFIVWDAVFGTDRKYRDRLAQREKAAVDKKEE